MHHITLPARFSVVTIAYVVGFFLITGVTFASELARSIPTKDLIQKPIVWGVTQTSATVSVPRAALMGMSTEDKAGLYVEVTDTERMCIAVAPTPPECLPKKVPLTFPKKRMHGKTVLPYARLTNLAPATRYSVRVVRDNTIRCITEPCPSNEYSSPSVEFFTKKKGGTVSGSATFTGTITAVSNACFADGECSITLTDIKTGESKKVITTIGWSREIVGRVRGAFDVIADDAMVGRTAAVYAKEVGKDYTLYGSTKYYIDIK